MTRLLNLNLAFADIVASAILFYSKRSRFSFTVWGDRSISGVQWSDRPSLSQLGAIALLVGFSRAIALLIHSLGRSLY